MGRTLLKAGGLCGIATLAAWPCLWLADLFPERVLLGAFVVLAVSGVVFAGVYLLLGRMYAPDMVRPVLERVGRFVPFLRPAPLPPDSQAP
ncbi:MAG: hypothetical protein D6E12_14330 [Desulfovibrio sp.]|nr:MAG: hypothetical protein D6E12_14330 [Desulfovibrio sp.]